MKAGRAAATLSPAARAGAQRLLKAGERVLWANEKRGLSVVWPRLVGLAVGLFIFGWVMRLAIPGLWIAADAVFGANTSKTPMAFAIPLGLFLILIAILTGKPLLKQMHRAFAPTGRVTLVTTKRLLIFDASLEPRADLHEQHLPTERIMAVATRRAPLIGETLALSVEHRPDETESGRREVRAQWLRVGHDAKGACAAIADLIAKRASQTPVSPDETDDARSPEP